MFRTYSTTLPKAFSSAACPPVRFLKGRKASSLAALAGQLSLNALKLTLGQYLNFMIWEQCTWALLERRKQRQDFQATI